MREPTEMELRVANAIPNVVTDLFANDEPQARFELRLKIARAAIAETLTILAGRMKDGTLTGGRHPQMAKAILALMTAASPPDSGEG